MKKAERKQILEDINLITDNLNKTELNKNNYQGFSALEYHSITNLKLTTLIHFAKKQNVEEDKIKKLELFRAKTRNKFRLVNFDERANITYKVYDNKTGEYKEATIENLLQVKEHLEKENYNVINGIFDVALKELLLEGNLNNISKDKVKQRIKE